MKLFLLLSVFVAVSFAQRPSFAGTSPKGVPNLASRFQPENSSSGTNLSNRFNTVDGTTERLPIDARGDADLVNRIKTWPEENRPFWYINAEAIEKHRGTQTQSKNTASSLNTVSQLENRFGENTGQIRIQNQLFFDAVINGQQKTYDYDPVSDSWRLRKN